MRRLMKTFTSCKITMRTVNIVIVMFAFPGRLYFLPSLHWNMEDKFVCPMSVQNVVSYNFPDDILCSFQSQIVMWQQIGFCGFKRESSWLAAVSVCSIKIDYCMQIEQFQKWGFPQKKYIAVRHTKLITQELIVSAI